MHIFNPSFCAIPKKRVSPFVACCFLKCLFEWHSLCSVFDSKPSQPFDGISQLLRCQSARSCFKSVFKICLIDENIPHLYDVHSVSLIVHEIVLFHDRSHMENECFAHSNKNKIFLTGEDGNMRKLWLEMFYFWVGVVLEGKEITFLNDYMVVISALLSIHLRLIKCLLL